MGQCIACAQVLREREAAVGSRKSETVESEIERWAGVSRFKRMTETVLPAQARENRWPVRFDHCFKRICLDYAFEDVWYRHLAKPAERHLAGESLARAVRCAEELAEQGLPLLNLRNASSLAYRGKLRA